MADLTMLIPARNELFLRRTIEDILANARADTEIIAVLDGEWADPQIEDDPRVSIIYHSVPQGHRACTTEAARMATSKWVMKCDAHCAFDEGFDVKMLAQIEDNWTAVPIMRNLHAFNWVCQSVLNLERDSTERQEHTRYQSPSGPCQKCGQPTVRDVVWIAKRSPSSTAFTFDATLHFQYFNDFKKRPEGQGDITETMSLQGSCFMMTRERFLKLNVCDPSWGFWGQQGVEVAVKSWVSGGRVVCNHTTYYAHMFRTQGGDFGFPYHLGNKEVEKARKLSRDIFFNNAWEQQVLPLSWLVNKFYPVPGWHDNTDAMKILEESDKSWAIRNPVKEDKKISTPTVIRKQSRFGVVYYTDNQIDPLIATACQNQLLDCIGDAPLAIVSLKAMHFGSNGYESGYNYVMNRERGYLSMFKQILTGLQLQESVDYVFLAEHDVLYHPSHFEFVPPRNDTYYYNMNAWRVRYEDGHALFYEARAQSGLCANRSLLLEHYRLRVEKTQRKFTELGDTREFRNFIRSQGFEAGTHHRSERVDDFGAESWRSASPNIDIRHSKNLTPNRWRQDQFRDQRNCRGWIEADQVPGWEYQVGKFTDFIKELSHG